MTDFVIIKITKRNSTGRSVCFPIPIILFTDSKFMFTIDDKLEMRIVDDEIIIKKV